MISHLAYKANGTWTNIMVEGVITQYNFTKETILEEPVKKP